MRAVILQPFYLPYTGVFELVRLADVFVHYDDVQYEKGGWINRNRVRTTSGWTWLTVPVQVNSDTVIRDVRIDNGHGWARKHERTFSMGYARAPFVDEVLSVVGPLWDQPPELLVDLNIELLEQLCDLLDIRTTFVRSSDLQSGGASTERVVNICSELGADSYLSGPAARAYLDERQFDDAGIALQYHRFDHPTWPQTHGGEYVDHLSIADAIANVGFAGVRELIHGCGHAVAAKSWRDEVDAN